MNTRTVFTLTCIGLLSWLSGPAAAFIIDDFSASDPAAGFTLDLDDSEILKSHLETGLPNGNVFGGARYVQLDWPTATGTFDNASITLASRSHWRTVMILPALGPKRLRTRRANR